MNACRPSGSGAGYRCGAIEIDATQRQVLIDGAPARIGARAFAVLLALVERRERVVSKQELMDLVWPRLVVEENNLLVHMVALRKILGPQAIATTPGRGYRFALPVEEVNGRADEPASTSAAVPGNLPPSPPLFGRAQDLEAVEALLREHPVVSIVGAAGIGKTRLALAAAVSTNCERAHGRWWVELAPITDGAQIPNTIASALALQLPSGRPPAEALAMALANRRLLLVLDNCEHLADEIAELVESLRARAPDVRLLLTSQELLKCREDQVYRLGALAVPESAKVEDAAEFGAVALFVERAHAVDSRFRLADDNVSVVVDICRRLDGIPLAIELAAARVPLLGVHGLHARLNQMFDVLSGGARMKLRRHQTLRAALEWSHELLSADEQAVFRRLGVFAGGFALELAQQVVSDERIDRWLVLDLLGRLIDKSLVIAQGEAAPRYRLLETTRAFALEQLARAGESDAMLRRHATAMVEFMSTIHRGWWESSPRNDRVGTMHELGNLRVALDWTLSSEQDRALAYELLGRCWPIWIPNGLIGEGIERMQRMWPPPPALPTRVDAEFCLGYANLNKFGAREEHLEAARRAAVLYRQRDDDDRLGLALLLVARLSAAGGRIPEARQALGEAEQLLSGARPLRKQAWLAEMQGYYYRRLGEHERAMAFFRHRLELLRRGGFAIGEYQALGEIGCAQLEAGDLDAAIDSLRASSEGLNRVNAPFGLERQPCMLALALAWRGDDVDVLPLAREAFYDLQFHVPFAPLMAAALQHARQDRPQRAVLVAGYAYSKLVWQEPPRALALAMQQRVRDRAALEHPAATVESWLRAGERLTEEQAATIAFDDAALGSSCA